MKRIGRSEIGKQSRGELNNREKMFSRLKMNTEKIVSGDEIHSYWCGGEMLKRFHSSRREGGIEKSSSVIIKHQEIINIKLP